MNIYTRAVPARQREANSKVVRSSNGYTIKIADAALCRQGAALFPDTRPIGVCLGRHLAAKARMF